jgi:membrane-bound inhibitor of C-type lysozyme
MWEGDFTLQDQESLWNRPMKKLLLVITPLLLSGCSYYNQFVDRMQTDTLEYQCDEKSVTVKLNNPRQEVSFVYDNKLLNLKQGMSASGARYTDGVYVFWSKGESATIYKRDRIVMNNCQLQNPKR